MGTLRALASVVMAVAACIVAANLAAIVAHVCAMLTSLFICLAVTFGIFFIVTGVIAVVCRNQIAEVSRGFQPRTITRTISQGAAPPRELPPAPARAIDQGQQHLHVHTDDPDAMRVLVQSIRGSVGPAH